MWRGENDHSPQLWTAVHSHALKAKAVHRVVHGGWEGGLLTALLPHGGAGGFIPKPHSEVLKSVQMPHPGTTPQIHTIGRMVVTYATRGNYGISIVMKIFWFISVTENSGAICFSLSCARFSKQFSSFPLVHALVFQIHSFSACNACKIKFTRNSLYCLIIMFTYSSRNATGEVISLCLTENFIILAL